MLGSAVRKIDFEWIDFGKLIVTKIVLKVKWFMFEYIDVKVSWIIKETFVDVLQFQYIQSL